MEEAEFKSEIEQILPLVLTYGADHYNPQQYGDPDTAMKKIGWANFANKCHEGFKLAQDKILNALLDIERESASYREKIKRAATKREIEDMRVRLGRLFFQEAVFKEVANVISWTILGMDRISIKALQQPDMHHKSLLESNIQSLIEVAEHYNKDRDKFALITDITSCIGMGDLIIIDTKENKFYLAEVKEGKVNNIILGTLTGGDVDAAENYLTSLDDGRAAKSFLKQFKRVLDQDSKLRDALSYSKVGVMRNLFSKGLRGTVEIDAVEEKFVPDLYRELEALYSQATLKERYFTFASGVVGLIRNPSMAGKWDFQHFIYHAILNPNAECPYTKYRSSIESLKVPEVWNHFNEILKVPLYDVKDKIFEVTHEPIFFNIPIIQAIDLFTDGLAIYIYFDPEKFFDLCVAAGLEPRWGDYDKAVQGASKLIRQAVVNFNGKCLTYGTNKVRTEFMKGLLFRMVYEFQTVQSLIMQMQGMVSFLKNHQKDAKAGNS